jgi:hypothetical protein
MEEMRTQTDRDRLDGKQRGGQRQTDFEALGLGMGTSEAGIKQIPETERDGLRRGDNQELGGVIALTTSDRKQP